jgi:benzaldehyde dehydrogenase (NAD)
VQEASAQWQDAIFVDGEFRPPVAKKTIGVRDKATGLQLALRLRAGMVHVHDATPQGEALAPFGGIGQSGLGGRSGGDSNIEEFTERRWLTVNPGPAHYPY